MGRVRGNKDGKFLTASLNGKDVRRFPKIKETKVLVLVSMIGNEFCAGDYLHASIDTATNRHGMATVLIADEVYWNNLRSLGPETPKDIDLLKEQAIGLGDEFLEKNMFVFLNLLKIEKSAFDKTCGHLSTNEKIDWINDEAKRQNISFEIVRWKDWINDPIDNYAEKMHAISNYYQEEPKLHDSIEDTAKVFAERHLDEGDMDLWLHRSRGYLTEESPAVMWCAASRGYEFIAYPGEPLTPFYTTRDFFVGVKPKVGEPDLAVNKEANTVGNWLDIHFKRHSGNAVTNIHPDAVNVAKMKLHEFKSSQSSEAGEDTSLFVPMLTQAILGDPKIDPNLKLSVLIAALGELNESSLQETTVISSSADFN